MGINKVRLVLKILKHNLRFFQVVFKGILSKFCCLCHEIL